MRVFVESHRNGKKINRKIAIKCQIAHIIAVIGLNNIAQTMHLVYACTRKCERSVEIQVALFLRRLTDAHFHLSFCFEVE